MAKLTQKLETQFLPFILLFNSFCLLVSFLADSSAADSYKLTLLPGKGGDMMGLGRRTMMFAHIRSGPTRCPAARLKQMSVLRPGLLSATLPLDTIQLLGSTKRNLSVKLPPPRLNPV